MFINLTITTKLTENLWMVKIIQVIMEWLLKWLKAEAHLNDSKKKKKNIKIYK